MTKLIVKTRYGITPNSLLNNPDLSLKAKGLFAYIQSKPDGWDFSGLRMMRDHKDGKDGLYSGLKELEEAGYLLRKKYKNKNGHWEYDYMLAEYPFTENPETEKPETEKPENNKERISKKELVNNKEDIASIHLYFQEKIQLKSRLTDGAKKKIQARLKSFSVEEIKTAIDNFCADTWQMTNNGKRGIAWFHRSDDKMEYYINMDNNAPKLLDYSDKK